MSTKSRILKKQYKVAPLFHQEYSNKRAFLLSSCSVQVILIASGLWLMQTSPLRAMDTEEPTRCSVKLEGQKRSERLGGIQSYISEIKENITKYTINSITLTPEGLIECNKIFKCTQSDTSVVQDLQDIKYNNLLWNSDDSNKRPGGWSGAKVIVLECPTSKIKVAIKKFKDQDIKVGLEELLYSLVALDINPSPKEIKMARIWDAAISSENSEECLNIIMECANGQDIHDILSIDNFSTNFSSNAIKACAEYLATFHIRNYEKLNQDINGEKYLAYAASSLNTLFSKPSNEDEEENKRKSASFSLHVKKPLLEFKEQLIEFEQIASDNVQRLLSREEQKDYIFFAKKSRSQFKKNSSENYRAIKCWGMQKEKSYFLTITHGDAHGNNFFYDNSNQLFDENQIPISEDSFYRVTMIDFASIIKTYGDIGDPAEDVGRFLGSLWDWAAKQEGSLSKYYKKIVELQEQFIQSYIKKIEENHIFTKENNKIFERKFKENCNCYKLRFYKIIANAKKDQNPEKDKDIKKKILQSWIKENADFEKENPVIASPPQKNITTKEPNPRQWVSLEGKIIHNLSTDPTEGFIESAAKGKDNSYLTQVWKKLYCTDTATLSSTAVIAGMGGIGKTSLALGYAHEAKDNKAYNLIYWLSSGSEGSLLEGYRELLREMGIPINGKAKEDIINLVKQHMPEWGKCLFIYDNVPDPAFLEGKTPKNIHILMTSRCNEGWEENWRKPITLKVFCKQDSIEYFFKITKLERTIENAKTAGELAKELGHLPLALARPAHYIELVGGPNVSRQNFEKYRNDFRKEPATHFEEQRNPWEEPESKTTYHNLIGRNLNMSRGLLAGQEGQNIAELAKKLLVYSSYLDPSAIAEEIFLECFNNKEDLQKALGQLSSESLIKREKDNPFFSMHPFLQRVIRNQEALTTNLQYKDMFLRTVSIFNEIFVKNISTKEQIDKLLKYLPHILQLLEYSKRFENFSEVVKRLELSGRILELIGESVRIENAFIVSPRLKSQAESKNKKLEKTLKKATDIFYPLEGQDDIQTDIPDWLSQIAEKSHPTVKATLGFMYQSDYCVQKNKEKAFVWYEQAANQNDAHAQCALGVMYQNAQGVGRDEKKAVEYFRLAAEQGNARAQTWLGVAFEDGCGVPQDSKEAVKWFKKAAAQGHTRAQVHLGWMYQNGHGVPKDNKIAVQYYQEAAHKVVLKGSVTIKVNHGWVMSKNGHIFSRNEKPIKWYQKVTHNGDAEAQFYLGEIHQNSCGVSRDDKIAVQYYQLAADQKHANAQIALAHMHKYGQGVPRDYKAAIELLKKAEYNGEANDRANAQYALGVIYSNGHVGIPKDEKKAVKYYRLAADQGNANAQYTLGLMHEDGQGVPKNEEEALRCFQKAAHNSHEHAQFKVWDMYANGRGIPKDRKEAVQYYLKAANQGHATAQFTLGEIFSNGRGISKNEKEAVKWYLSAAHQGHATAQYMAGVRYLNGRGISKDEKEARKWLQKAADQGNSNAQYMLGCMYEEGQGGSKKDDVEALRWYQKSAHNGHEPARTKVSDMRKDGRGIPKDNKKTINCSPNLTDERNTHAQYVVEISATQDCILLKHDGKVIKFSTLGQENINLHVTDRGVVYKNDFSQCGKLIEWPKKVSNIHYKQTDEQLQKKDLMQSHHHPQSSGSAFHLQYLGGAMCLSGMIFFCYVLYSWFS